MFPLNLLYTLNELTSLLAQPMPHSSTPWHEFYVVIVTLIYNVLYIVYSVIKCSQKMAVLIVTLIQASFTETF